MSMHHLIVVTGPVAGGKSSSAASLAACLRTRGVTTAVVGLDELYLMGRQHPDKWDEPEIWLAGLRAAGTLAESFYASGLGAVVVEGEVFTEQEWRNLRTSVRPDVDVNFFTLVVSWEEVLRRRKADPTRPPLKPGAPWLKRMHEKFLRSLGFLRDVSVCIDADTCDLDQRAALMADEVLGVKENDEGETI